MSTDLSTIGNMFKTNNSLFERATRDIAMEHWLKRPGEDSNPLLWIAGHAVVSRASALKLAGGQWSAPWEKLFARGARLPEAEEYPSPAEIQRAWQEVSEKLAAALPKASAEALGKEVQKGQPSLDGTVGGTIGFLCLHESYHMGQLGFVRKCLGYGQAVG